MAVAEDSGLCYTWGNGSHGQLGRVYNNSDHFNLPEVVEFFMRKITKVVDVAAGGKHTLFLTGK